MILSELSKSFFQVPMAWDRFWFSPASTRGAALFRFALAAVAVVHFAVFASWVPQWLSGDGWFDLESARYIIGEGLPDTGSQYRWSILFRATQPWVGFAVCSVGMLASVAALLGLGNRIPLMVAWICMLTIHHRAPWLSMPGEILLTAGLFYAMIDPGRTAWTLRPGFDDGTERISANLLLRCGQIHLLLWLVFSVASMLQYSIWWNGNAVPLLSRQTASLVGALPDSSYLGQAWTLAILALQIGAAFLLTQRSTVAVGMLCLAGFALLVAAVAGDWLYGLTLLAMGTCFVPIPRSSTPSNQLP